jgi:hypothetical protein
VLNLLHNYPLMRNAALYIFFVLLCSFSHAASQPFSLEAGKGIASPEIHINRSTKEDVLKAFDDHPVIKFEGRFTSIDYPVLGLTFYYDEYDSNRIIRSIEAKAPFTLSAKDKIITIGQTKLDELTPIFGDHGVFVGGGDPYMNYVPMRGICFYIEKKTKKLAKIGIYAPLEWCTNCTSDENFVYRIGPELEKRKLLYSILKDSAVTFTGIQKALQRSYSDSDPYSIKFEEISSGKTEHGFTTHNAAADIGTSYFDIYALTRNDTLAYMVLKLKDSVIWERIHQPLVNELSAAHRSIYGMGVDIHDRDLVPLEEINYSSSIYEVDNMVVNRDYRRLAKCLRSISPGLQLQAAAGLYYLKRMENMLIMPEETAVIDHLSGSELCVKANYNRSCIGWHETRKIKEIIKDIRTDKHPRKPSRRRHHCSKW